MIIKQFIQQVKRHPEKCAVKAADTAISYNELHQRTDYIAQLIWDSLHENKKEQPTALLFQHGIDMIAGVLATLKSGNIYVPFDPSYPEKRLAYMLADSRASLLVTNTANLPTAQRLAESTETPDKKIKILNIDSIDTSRPAPQIDESLYETDGIAYLLYTSGSTGKPKGVIQSHKNILHFIKCYSDNLEITDKDRLTLFSAFSHDAAVMDIYTALLKGATLYPLNIKEADITGIADWLKEEEITVWHSVPTIYRYFVNTLTAMEKFPHLRFLVMGGEAVLPEDVFRFKRLFPEAVFVNLYGQSESSYNSSQFITKDSPFEKVLLGDPIDEVTLLVVDEEGEEVAPFREGEIVVANNYAATGYWNDEEKTEQAFMEDEDMGRLYWTGDRGRLLLDDQIEFTGRVDFQIKIRGYRVELGEIETALLSHDSVEETVVVALDQADGQKMLCAYVVPAPGKKITIHELREFLAQEVMEHMIPSYFVQLEKLPVTPTGKIDRNALPEIEGRILTGAEYAAPTDKVEENLVAIWQEVLHQSKVGIDDHFFEIGGHSLRATVLAARVHKAMSIEFPLKEIFRTPTVRAMARYIRAAEEAAYSEIPRAKKRDFYPLSSAQKRMYLLSGIEGEGTGYNISKMVEIIGLPNKEKLENAFRQLVTRHDSLRTSFGMEAGQPVQVVHDGAPAPCDGGSFAIEWIEGDSASQNADTVALLREFVRPFDLGKAPLLRVRVTRLEARKHLLMMDMHHIIADGTSMGIIANDLAQLYAGESLPELRVQYKDFAAHQNGVFATGVIAKQQEYWKETFSDEIPLLDLPLDWVRPEVQSFQGGSLGFQLEPTSTKRLKEIASGCKTSLYMVLLALYNVLLSIYSRSEDVIVGTPTAGRTHPDLEGMVGMFVNTLAVRNYPRGEKTFLAFLEDVKKQVLDAFENQDYQFDALVDMLEIRRDLGRNPLFDTMFTLQNIEMPEIKANDLLFRQVDYEDNISKFDVTLTAYEMEEGLGMDLQYCSALFKRETVERMARHFLNIIRVVSADPLTLLESVDILSGEERRRILVDFNDTASDYPESKTIVTLLTEQAARTPGSVAVKGANLQGQMNTSLTYGDLLEQSYCLACTLAARGLGPGRTCAVVSGQTVEMIPAILGILRTGAAYVPIDPQYPAERIAYILEDSGVEILLTSVEVAKSITCKKEIFHLEWIKDLTETDTPLPPTTPSGAAYIIYTSGSTGKPKGVLTAHRALVNMCRWNKEYYQLQPTDRMSKYVGFGFDVSLWEIFPTLGVGACLCIVPDDIRLDVKKLNEFYEAEGVTISFLPPQIGEQFMAGVDNQSLRVLQVGGDKLRGYVLRNYRLVNNYGPTEYAVVTTSFPVTEAHQNIPIGKPIANTSLYVLGKNRQMQPVGAPGELYISGHGLALGYLNRPGLTADTFVPNPFEPGQRIYKTGDLVSWLPDGNMRFLGRLDSQVKIRGYRIELGEIENLLNRHEEIKNVTAIPRSTAAGEGDPYICAYVVPMNRAVDGPQLIQRLREYLAHSLPSYMVPAYFVIMEKIPLTANGKVNRKALPAPEVGTARIYKPPRNLLEERLVKSWSEVLAVDSAKIGIDDNFFEMGGHSLKAAALSGRVLKELNIPLPMREIFKSPTVSLMAAYLKERKEVAYKPVVPAAKRPYYPLTPAQKRLFILRRMESGGTAYNITTMVRVTGALDEAKIQQVFQQLVNRHKSLRTVFETVKGEAVARILPEAEIRLETYEAAAGRHEMAMRDFIRPFDMARAPLIRVGIIKPGTEDSTGQTSVATAMECRHDASGGPPRGVGFPAGSPKGGASLPGVAGPLEPLCSNLKPTFQGGQDTGGTQKKATDAEADGATCYLMMDMHHIISDGVSMGIITRELMDAYEGRDLPQLRLQYKDYALWLEDPAGSGVLEEQEKYWLDVFAGELPVPDIPTDFPRPALQHFEGRGIDFSINEQLTEGLKRIAADEGATLFMILLAVFNILLARYGRVEDIVVGTPTAGRRNADLETIVGMFVNTLPLRNRPGSLKPFSTNTGKEKSKPAFDGSPALRQVETAQAPHLVGTPPHVVGFVEELKERTLEAFDNQDYQFEDLIEKLDLRRDLSRSPLFDTMFTFQNIDIPFVEVEGLRFEHSDFENPIAKFDIILTGSESEGSLNFTFQYSTALFKDETMRRMAGHFENLVSAVVKNPSLAIGHLEMLSTEEKKQILLDFNDTASDYPEAKTIIEIFHQQVESTPENIAVKGADLHSGETSISYLDLHRQSSRLACTLAGKGLGPGKVGAVMSGQTVEMLPATLGILKTGAAYVPIAPHTPAQRIGYILQDSGADVFLTSKEDAEYITYEGEKFHLEALKDLEATDARLPVADPSAPAYIIYTSGSTGKPKGVITAHNALVNLCWWYRSYYQLQSSDRTTKYAGFGFDASLMEMFPIITVGGCLCIVPGDIRLDIKQLNHFYEAEGITVSFLPPQIAEQFMAEENNRSLRTLLVGGDKLRDYVPRNYRLVNNYGPTENAVVATVFPLLHPRADIPIGKPIANTSLYVLDKNLNTQPVGVPGELYISGAGQALGYLNRPDLTSAAFVPNPFQPGKRMYKTGDLVSWLPDGNIRFLGRLDFQVKIRGFRIELGEIETAILGHQSVKNAVVITHREEPGNSYLCAYVVPADNRSWDKVVPVLREHLARSLPDYMIPAYFIHMETLPLNAAGKVNRGALREPEGSEHVATGVEFLAPRDETEQKLADIYGDLLRVEQVGIDDDFFRLGGHSLKATQLVGNIHKFLDVSLTLTEVFKTPTVRGLAQKVKEAAALPKTAAFAAIEQAPLQEYYPMSSGQRRMYLAQITAPENTSYNMPMMIELEGRLNRERLIAGLRQLVNRHESFRTSFLTIDTVPKQQILPRVQMEVEYFDLQGTGKGEKITELLETFIRPFDMKTPPHIRARLVKQEEHRHIMMLDMHHIVSDGVSMGIFTRELMDAYEGRDLPGPEFQYKDYAVWQEELSASGVLEGQEKYWLEVFAGELPVLDIHTDYPRPALQQFEGRSIAFGINETLTKKLKTIAAAQGATLYMMVLGLYNILLSRYGRVEDVIVGTPTAGRRDTALESIVGMFVNTLALRNFPAMEKPFSIGNLKKSAAPSPRGPQASRQDGFLEEVRKRTLEAFDNQDYQFEDIVETLELRRDLSRSPLFDTMFSFQDFDIPDLEVEDLKFQHMEFENPIAKFDLTLTASESAGRLHFTFQYATSLFKEETIQRMAGHLKNLVSSAAANPSVAIGNMEMLSAEEKRRILVDFNDTASDYPESKTIIDIFNRQVESTPENIAVKGADLQGGETSISYRDLHRQSSALACALAGKGLGPGKVGAVMSGQTVEMIPVILALLKTGAAYVPIDPRYPADRIGYILEDSNAAVFLTSREAAENITYEKEIIYLEEIENLEAAEASLPVTDPSAPAYIIYTSGSTGRPKGVITGHRALVNLCWWNRAYYHLLESDRMSKYVGFGFDVSLWEIFPTLSVGACLCIVPENIRLDVRKLNEFYESEGITLSFLPPQIAEQFMAEEDNRSLRYLQVGGDKLREYVPRNYQVVNNYGPTEYTVIASIFPVDCPHANIPIGKPLANTSLYVLDKTQKVQPVGVPGELYISGDGLAMGYLNRPDLTAGAFVPNPFQPGERMYKTGDLAAWLPDGNIQYLGRLDFQVKIRGFRIELGEIETAILGHQSVKDAVVITREETPGNFYLCAYVVPTGVPDWSEFIPLLRETLARSLPDYMIPAYFVRMDVLPLNAAGKVNRRFLPEPQDSEHAATGVEFLAPRDETEQKLADIYGDLLRVKQVGIDDDFFRMGGHSLKATQLVGHIHKSLNVSLSLTEVFKSPTVRGLAQKVNELSALPRKGEFAAIEKTPQQEYYPLSAIQRRMYLAQVTAPGNTSYNLPMVTELVGRLDRELLTDVLQQLVNRHESFRTSFLTVDALPKQKIIPRVRMEVEYFDPAKTGTGKAEEIVEIFETFIRPFDMLEPPHIRAGLVKREEERHILMLDMHHIISDGSSLNVLFEEFMTLYDGKSLPPPKLQYKDFVYWQESEARQVEIKKQALYWLQLYRKTPQVLQLPLDFPRPKIKGFKGLHHYFYMDRDTTDKITALAKEEGSTLFMVLLGLYNVLLSKLTGLEDIVVGTSIAGRRHTDLQPIVGMFVNALALRNFPSGDKTFLQFIKELRDNTLAAFENQDYSFEELVDFVGGSRDPGRNPIFDTMFILNNEEDIEEFRIPGLILKGCEEFRHTTAQMDIKFRVRETEQGLTMAYEYSTALFKPETMEMFAANFNEVAAAVLESPEVLLSDIRITHGLQEVKVDISDISFDF